MMRKILIVDDNPDDIEITRAVLEERGWDVQVVVVYRAPTSQDPGLSSAQSNGPPAVHKNGPDTFPFRREWHVSPR